MMKNDPPRRVLIVGGGAGGLAAAVAAARAEAQVTILEKANRVGKKLLRTGNGRCNLSNLRVSPAGYNCPDFVSPLLKTTDCAAVRDFFASLGLWTVADGEGRVYPRSDAAASVLDVLRLGCAAYGVREICSAEVTAVRRTKNGFAADVREQGEFTADRVIIASGGGTALLRPLGHSLTPFSPVLCPLRTDTGPIRGLSGLRVKCRASLGRGSAVLTEESGELLFRDFGVSGILALDLSRYARRGDILSLDLMPELTTDELCRRLETQRSLARPENDLLTGIFHRRVGEALIRAAGGTDSAALARSIKAFRLTVEGPGDVQNAQVTRGGAAVDGFDPLTLESRLHPGLYAAGEALDVDGRCGGYNLHWAFASGLAAGRSAGS